MATSTGLIGSDVHEVQQAWTGQKNPWVTLCVAKTSQKDICFFWVVPPTKLPKIMGLKGIHSPEALRSQSGLSFCLWYVKEGQNKGMVVNHLQMSHYHLGLICSYCLEYFTTSTDAMHLHLQLCKLALAGIDDEEEEEDQEEESNIDGNGECDDHYTLPGIFTHPQWILQLTSIEEAIASH